MADGQGWQQIPSDLLDLSKVRNSADTWATQQRQKVADVWAQAQRSLLDAAVGRWRDQAAAVTQPSMTSSSQTDSAVSPAGPSGSSSPGYNDMAGVDTRPPLNAASTFGTPPGIQSPGFAPPDATPPAGYNDMSGAASPQPDYSRLPGMGGVQPLPGANPLVNIPQAIAQRVGDTAQEYNEAFTPTRPTPPGAGPFARYTPEQLDAQNQIGLNMVLGVNGEAPKVVGEAAAPLANDAEQVASAAGNEVQGVGGSLIGKAKDAVTRMFHGTGSAFDSPEAAKFDPNGLFGPGYYLTDNPQVAGSGTFVSGRSGYAEIRAPNGPLERQIANDKYDLAHLTYLTKGQRTNLQRRIAQGEADLAKQPAAESGPNVRAVNVPQGLKLLDADAPIAPADVRAIAAAAPPQSKLNVMVPLWEKSGAIDHLQGDYIYRALRDTQGPTLAPGNASANQILQSANYDGIRYNGGQRIPLTDENGAPIQHTAVVIFPDSLPKITNALSGRPMGVPPSVGGAVLGGVVGSQAPAENDQQRARNIAVGALGGGLVGHGLAAAGRGETLPMGMSVEDASRTAAGDIPRTEAAPASPPPSGTAPPTIATPPLGPDARAGNILLRKYASPDAQQIIADTAAKDPATMEAARRGVVSDQTVQDLADAVGQNVDKIVKRWKPGNAANAETITALRSALSAKADAVSQLADIAKSGSPADLLNLQVALREHQAVQEAVSGTTAEAGRSLRALRATVTSAVQSGDAAKMQDLLKKLGGVEWTQDLATKLSQLDPGDKVGRYDFLRNAMKPQLHNYLTELWYNAMLSGPKTHLVKSLSETASLLLMLPERAASAAVEAPLAALQGRPRQRFFGEIAPEAFGMAQGIPEGLQKALFTIQKGYRLSDVLNTTDYLRTSAFRGPAGAVINFPSRTMAAAAEFSAAIAQSGALSSGAYRAARIEGLSGQALIDRVADLRANPTAALLKYAHDQGQYRVYQQPPGKFVQSIAGVRAATPLGIGRIILPFLQTPANLVAFGLQRSPLGALNPSIYKNLANKSPEAADQIGRWAMGSMAAAGIAVLAAKGDITGPAPQNPGERDAWTRVGKTPFSLRIGDKWVSYQKLEPLNQTFSQVASLVDAIKRNDSATDVAAQVAATIGTNLVSQTYMQSLSGALNAIQDPARYGGRFLDSLAGSVVPSAVRTITQNIDPTMREAQGPLEAIQAQIPGQSQNLPPRLNAFGEPIQRDVSNISPIAVSQAVTSPLEQELARYGVETGLTGKTLQGLDLTRQEMAEHQGVAGQRVKQLLTQLVADPRYQQLTDVQKARALQLAITRAKDQAARLYVGQLVQRQGAAAITQRIQQKKLQRLPKAG